MLCHKHLPIRSPEMRQIAEGNPFACTNLGPMLADSVQCHQSPAHRVRKRYQYGNQRML